MEREVCHCFGVLAEAVLLTLRGANDGFGGGTACPKADKQWHILPQPAGLRLDAHLNRLRPDIAEGARCGVIVTSVWF